MGFLLVTVDICLLYGLNVTPITLLQRDVKLALGANSVEKIIYSRFFFLIINKSIKIPNIKKVIYFK